MGHLQPLMRIHPRGAWDLDADGLVYKDLQVLAHVLDDADAQTGLLLLEALPDHTTDLLTSWERVYNIHRIAGKTTAQRRNAVLARRRFLPDFTVPTIENILERFTELVATVVEPGLFRCSDANSVCDEPGDVVDGAFVFLATFSEADARVAGIQRDEVNELIQDMEPAHVCGFMRCDDFRTNDQFSTCDLDTIGA